MNRFFNMTTCCMRALLCIASFLFLLSSSANIAAQNRKSSGVTVRGKVISSDETEALYGASIRLTLAKDSSLIKGMVSDKDGLFAFENVKRGSYRLYINYMGMRTIDTLFHVGAKSANLIDLGTFKMEGTDEMLESVVVAGVKAAVKVKKDTTEFNAGSFKVSEGANVEELLKKLPGMKVDEKGNIKYNGESIEGLQLNGRDFFTEKPTFGTQNLPSKILDKVQVVDKKSDESIMTGMDDGQKKKILNLVVKKGMDKGLTGNFDAGYGTDHIYQSNLMINAFRGKSRYTIVAGANNKPSEWSANGYPNEQELGFNLDHQFSKKLSINADLGFDRDAQNKHVKNISTELSGGDKAQQKETTYDYSEQNRSLSGRFKLEWKPDTLTQIIITPNFKINSGDHHKNETFFTNRLSGDKINSGTKLDNDESKGQTLGLRFDGSRKLNNKGRTLHVGGNASYNKNDNENSIASQTQFYQKAPNTILRDQQLEQTTERQYYRLRSSWVEPLSSKVFLQLSYNPELNNSYNDRTAYNKDSDGNYTSKDPTYSKSNEYRTITNRFGLALKYQQKGLSLQGGFDWVPTSTQNKFTLGNGEEQTPQRFFWDYSPTLRIRYSKGANFNLFSGYRGRTQQPNANQLLPIEDQRDPLHVVVGNPDLLPSFVHWMHLGMSYSNLAKRSFINFMFWGNYEQRGIVNNTTIDENTGASRTGFENVDGSFYFSSSITYSRGIGKSPFRVDLGGYYYQSDQKTYANGVLGTQSTKSPSVDLGISYNNDNFSASLKGSGSWNKDENDLAKQLNRNTSTYSINADFSLDLPWKMNLDCNYKFSTRSGFSDVIDKEYHILNAKLSKLFLKDNAATLELAGFDLLGQGINYQRNISVRNIVDNYVNGVTRYGMLTFRYKFNLFGGAKASNYNHFNSRRYRVIYF